MPAEPLYIRDELQQYLHGEDPFTYFSSQDGEVFRALEFRRTYAIVLGEKNISSSITRAAVQARY